MTAGDLVVPEGSEDNFSREWLETNGLGGWASSTVSGAHTRRYHGLLVVATCPPVGRVVLLSRLDETLVLPTRRVELSCSIFSGVIHPRGDQWLTAFVPEPVPTWTYAGDGWVLRKRLALLAGEHALVVAYELVQAPGPLCLELRPFFAGRDYHHLVQANDQVARTAAWTDDVLAYQPYPDQPPAYIYAADASWEAAPDWYYNFQYPREEERGLDHSEDLFTPGHLRLRLAPGATAGVLATTELPACRDPLALLTDEIERRQQVEVCTPWASDPLLRLLARAADQFLVRRGDGLHTVVAGYHWFTDWGRDTMIALPGLCLVTGRFAEARGIFAAFAEYVSEGMIPNRFPDAGEEPEYHAVDATLWFFVALYKYLQYTEDYEFARELWPTLEDIAAWHERGTRHQIRVDDDGLLTAGEPGVQLTWMDAKIGDWVVTPRMGKPVEVNALWYNALKILQHLGETFGQRADYGQRAAEVQASFDRLFWCEERGYLCDVVAPEGPDWAIRPNQIFALSLPFPLVEGERARRILSVIDEHLLTPRGLRSLSPHDPAYCAQYAGGPWERDSAYHQGTVWGWLIGPYITALCRCHGRVGRQRGRALLDGFAAHLNEAGVGTVSEIFDAEPPFAPRGCIAQAWSVAELLRAGVEDVWENGSMVRV